MDIQTDHTKNYGEIIGAVYFGVGNQGPVDGTLGSDLRKTYQAMCDRWVNEGVKPEKLVPYTH